MNAAIRRAVQALTLGSDAERHFDLAAKRIQESLLAVAVPAIRGFDLGVHAEPARLVGGDYIDLYPVTDSEELVFALGDASGKSLAAAMTALMLRYLVRGLVTAQGTDDLPNLMRCINHVVSEDLSDGAFITFILGVLDARTGALRAVNAGHEPPLLLRSMEARVQTVDTHGIVLGIDGASPYRDLTVELGVGDIIVIYTDGLTEATNKRGEMYTIERLSDEIVRYRDESPDAIAHALFENIREYADGEFRDDATILVVKRSGE